MFHNAIETLGLLHQLLHRNDNQNVNGQNGTYAGFCGSKLFVAWEEIAGPIWGSIKSMIRNRFDTRRMHIHGHIRGNQLIMPRVHGFGTGS